jgi:gas vesicle protein
MNNYFSFNDRLGIPIPDLQKSWDSYAHEEQQDILVTWEKIRGRIPDRIAELENMINHKQSELDNESDFPRSCQLNSEISDLASVINDLWLWYRTNQDVSMKVHM